MTLMRRARWLCLAGLTAGLLAGCEMLPMDDGGAPPAPAPQAPATAAPVRPPAGPEATSEDSRALAKYYARLQQDLLVQGLLRTDGGGPDTPFTDTMLIRDFERIALAEEYARGAGFTRGGGELGRVKKWTRPVRISVEFGASVGPDRRVQDTNEVTLYARRLARVTGHPISVTDKDPNFFVLFMGEDDKARIKPRIRALVPEINAASLAIFDDLPRSIHCLVLAFSGSEGGYDYARAVALIRTEHPDLLRQSCIHEEIAQGLGLGNDSPVARPSIFNDDDEFALLTTHDEMLLKILYDPRLKPGMTADRARPVVREMAARLTGGPS